jgi:hypothetical protein
VTRRKDAGFRHSSDWHADPPEPGSPYDGGRLGLGSEPSHPRLSLRDHRRHRAIRLGAALGLLLLEGRQLVFARIARRRLR